MTVLVFLVCFQNIKGFDKAFGFAKVTPMVIGVSLFCLAGVETFNEYSFVPQAHDAALTLLNARRAAKNDIEKREAYKNYFLWYKDKKGKWPSVFRKDFSNSELLQSDYLEKNINNDKSLGYMFNNLSPLDFSILSSKILKIARHEAQFHYKKPLFLHF